MTEIRDLIAALKALPPGHPLENLLREAPDFRQEAALADALLHPQDRAYSVPQLFDFIDKGRTDIRPVAQTSTLQPLIAASWRRSRRLAGWHSFPWRNSMPPSNCFAARWFATAWLRTATTALAARKQIGFDRRRLAWLTCPFECRTRSVFEERLPPGAAAVLINQAILTKTSICRSTKPKRDCSI